MDKRDLAEVLAILNKLKIESNSNLSSCEKEIMKQFIDVIKREAQRG